MRVHTKELGFRPLRGLFLLLARFLSVLYLPFLLIPSSLSLPLSDKEGQIKADGKMIAQRRNISREGRAKTKREVEWERESLLAFVTYVTWYLFLSFPLFFKKGWIRESSCDEAKHGNLSWEAADFKSGDMVTFNRGAVKWVSLDLTTFPCQGLFLSFSLSRSSYCSLHFLFPFFFSSFSFSPSNLKFKSGRAVEIGQLAHWKGACQKTSSLAVWTSQKERGEPLAKEKKGMIPYHHHPIPPLPCLLWSAPLSTFIVIHRWSKYQNNTLV